MVAAEDLLCAMMMTMPLVMPFVQGILFGMHLVNSQETQVVCHQEHPCFEGHTRVGIILEAANGGGRRFALRDDDDDNATGDTLRSGHPVWHAPGELTRDSGVCCKRLR
jgi:hypothetical protein